MIKVSIEGLEDLASFIDQKINNIGKMESIIDEHGQDSSKDLIDKIDAVRNDLGLPPGIRTHELPLMSQEDAEAAMENEGVIELNFLGDDLADYITEE